MAATGSLKAAFFRLSSSSNMSLIDFLVAGFWVFVHTAARGVDEGLVGDDSVTDADVEADAEGTIIPGVSLADDFAPA